MASTYKTLGILGGMGPAATVDLYEKIIRHTDADCDQAHLHVYIDSNSSIPDRTAAILSGTKAPLPALVDSAKKLEAMGAQVLLMACNTAHYFYDDILGHVNIPFLHMMEETASALASMDVHTAALLATDGVVQSGLYAKALGKAGIAMCLPDTAGQRAVMSLIYDCVKAGKDHWDLAPMQELANQLLAAGAEVLILGCTELPLAFSRFADLAGYPTIDPTALLAKAAVRFAGAPVRE